MKEKKERIILAGLFLMITATAVFINRDGLIDFLHQKAIEGGFFSRILEELATSVAGLRG